METFETLHPFLDWKLWDVFQCRRIKTEKTHIRYQMGLLDHFMSLADSSSPNHMTITLSEHDHANMVRQTLLTLLSILAAIVQSAFCNTAAEASYY